MVAEAAKTAKPGEWIVGRGWHQEKWTSRPTPNVEGFPTHASLDAVSPNNPVLLTHASGHASFVNAQGDGALRASRARRRTPPGGEILKDAAGEPDRAAARDGVGPRPHRRRAATPARARKALELASAGGAVEGDHLVPGRRLVVRDHRPDEADDRRRADRACGCG